MDGDGTCATVGNERDWARRRVVRTAVGVGAATLAGTAAGTAAAQARFDGWLGDTSNFDGTVVDRTGQDEVTIAVGTEGNMGPNAFDPPAVRVSPGTTVIWEWTGEGTHNVVEEGGGFESELTGSEGHTFEHVFDAEGTTKYYCNPHRSLGMKGVVVVGGSAAPGGGGGGTAVGLPGLLLGGLGTAIVAFVAGVYVGGRRTGIEQNTAAMTGIGVTLLGVVVLAAIVAKLTLGA